MPPKVASPRALVFDFDGTLIDTETVELESLQYLWRTHGLKFDEDRWHRLMGREAPDWVGILVGQLAELRVSAPELRTALRRDQNQRTARQPLRPGIAAMVDLATERGIPLGVASNANRQRVEQGLRDKNLHQSFAAVVTREDVQHGKPAPDVYLKACKLLDVEPSECVAFEDSEPGMWAALAAGLRCIVIPTSFTATHDFSTADLVVTGADKISLVDLRAGVLRST